MFWIYLGVGVIVVIILIVLGFISLNIDDVPRHDGYPHDNAQSPRTDADYAEEQERGSGHD